jgi:hypothetical protein
MAEGPKPRGNPNIRSVQKRFTADKDGVRDERIWRRGRPPGQKVPRVVVWDLKQAAKAMCKEALLFIRATMRNEAINHDTRLRAAQILLERGYGRPEVTAEIDVNHRFAYALVPEVKSREAWLRDAEVTRAEQAAKRTGESPTGVAGHSTEERPPVTIDLEVEELPREPPGDASKLN